MNMLRSIRSLLVLTLVVLLASAIPGRSVPAALAAGPSLRTVHKVYAPGDTVNVVGNGFAPNDVVTVRTTVRFKDRTDEVVTSQPTNGYGMFVAAFVIPKQTLPGVYQTVGTDSQGHSASVPLTVAPLVWLQPGTTPKPVTVVPQRQFAVRGTGWGKGETVGLSADFPLYDGNTVTVYKAAATTLSGQLAEVFLTVPNDAKAGTVVLTGTGSRSKVSAQAPLAVTYRPRIAPADTSLPPGGSTKINGAGFVPNTAVKLTVPVTLTNGNVLTVSASPVAGNKGGISAGIQLPQAAAPGTYTVTAVDSVGKFKATTHIAVTLKPVVQLKPATAYAGQTVAVVGSGFTANTAVDVSADFPILGGVALRVSTTVHTDGAGHFSGHLTIPANATDAAVTVTATGPQTAGHAVLHVRHVTATVSVKPNVVLPGHTITVSGSGYTPGVTVTVSATVALYGGGARVISRSVQAGANGSFSAKLTVPARAAPGTAIVTAQGPHRRAAGSFVIQHLGIGITVVPPSVIPGGTVTVQGHGFPAGDSVAISVVFTLTNGSHATGNGTATASSSGAISASIHVPANAASGRYTVTATSSLSGRRATAVLTVATLSPAIVITPATAAPGTKVTVTGFGFPAGAEVALTFGGAAAGSATTNAAGKFTAVLAIPAAQAAGTVTITAVGGGRQASGTVTVVRQIVTHIYFPSLYTGTNYQERIAVLNPTETLVHVSLTYQLKMGAPLHRSFTVAPHSRYTENVNADIGFKVSAAAALTADLPVAAERFVTHGIDGAVDPGTMAPATVWYFANGNTSKRYREYIAIQNPNSSQIQVGIRFLPTHSHAFTIYRTMGAASRLTIKVNSFVPRDAVGVIVRSGAPIVANRTIFIRNGMTSKTGVTAPEATWSFAAGPHNPRAHHWIGAINPTGHSVRYTLHAYGPFGVEDGTVSGVLRPFARAGFLINHIAHRADAAVVLTSSAPIVAEQTTYLDRRHDTSTDTFGVARPATSWAWAAVNTLAAGGMTDRLDLFNPSLAPIPVVVRFLSTSGSVTERTYVVNPLAHQTVDVGSIMPNAQLGITADSSSPFVALNRGTFSSGRGAFTSTGDHT